MSDVTPTEESTSITYDESNINWVQDRETNLYFLKGIMQHMNNKLVVTGHLFLNEVYDALRVKHTSNGAIMGWMFNGVGTTGVEFTLKETSENHFVIEFNVDDEPIWNRI